MPDTEEAPGALTFCDGRLIGEPVVTKITLYNGRKVTYDQGRNWTLDGKPIHPVDAHVFRCMWTPENDSSMPAAA